MEGAPPSPSPPPISPSAACAPSGGTSALPLPRCPPITLPLRTGPRHTTNGPATVFVRSKCSGSGSLGNHLGRSSPPSLAVLGCRIATPSEHKVQFRLTASPAGWYQEYLEGPCTPREAEVGPATTACVSFGTETAVRVRRARTAHSATCERPVSSPCSRAYRVQAASEPADIP